MTSCHPYIGNVQLDYSIVVFGQANLPYLLKTTPPFLGPGGACSPCSPLSPLTPSLPLVPSLPGGPGIPSRPCTI